MTTEESDAYSTPQRLTRDQTVIAENGTVFVMTNRLKKNVRTRDQTNIVLK